LPDWGFDGDRIAEYGRTVLLRGFDKRIAVIKKSAFLLYCGLGNSGLGNCGLEK
jgi:hypothetical protein